MTDTKPPSWLDPDGELSAEIAQRLDEISPRRRSRPLSLIMFVVLVTVATLLIGATALYLQMSSYTPPPTLIPSTPALQIPSEYFDARYLVRVRYDYSIRSTGSCAEERVYGRVDGTERFVVRAQDGDRVLAESPIQTDRQFDLRVAESVAPRYDVWLVDASGERVTGITDIDLGHRDAPTCTIEVLFYPANQSGQG